MSTIDAVEAALERALSLGEVGIQVSAYLGDEQILDLCCGATAARTGAPPVTSDTLFPVFSVTKAVSATALHLQATRGLVDYNAPVASYWPEFAAQGKEGISVRDVLTHRSRMAAMPPDVTPELMADWEWMVSSLAAMPPEIDAYHTISWGWLVGEVVRRTDPEGRPFAQFLQDELFDPLGIDDFHVGLDAKELPRVAELSTVISTEVDPTYLKLVPPAISLTPEVYNTDVMRQGVSPGGGGIATANATARFFAMLANDGELDGVRLFPAGSLRAFAEPRSDPWRPDGVAGTVRWIGMGGYWLGGESPPAEAVFGDGAHVLGHPGAGGTYAWADLDSRLAVSITHNRMFPFEGLDREHHPFVDVAEAVRKLAGT